MHALRLDKIKHSVVTRSDFFGKCQTYFANERLTCSQLKDQAFMWSYTKVSPPADFL